VILFQIHTCLIAQHATKARKKLFLLARKFQWWLSSFLAGGCGIISKIKVLHLKIQVYMKNVVLFTH